MAQFTIGEEEGRALISLIESDPQWQVEELYHQLVATFPSEDPAEEVAATYRVADPHRQYQMFTPKGNAECAALVAEIRQRADAGEFQNRVEMAAVTRIGMEKMAEVEETSEVFDTEPRNAIADELDAICKAKGWAFDRWDSGL